MITIQQMVDREVQVCLSSLVSTLASGTGRAHGKETATQDLFYLCDQAAELAAPVPDYEESAIQAGWENYLDKYNVSCWRTGDSAQDSTFAGTAEQLCNAHDIEPYEREVYEHWAVSNWLAEKLIAHGEKVDTDFANMNVWARTCTGQGIASDGVIERIYNGMVGI